MPIFQYNCQECDEDFEYFNVRSNDKPTCPSCASTNLQKGFSVFSVANSKANVAAIPPSVPKVEAKPKKHFGCATGYAKSLLKKYG